MEFDGETTVILRHDSPEREGLELAAEVTLAIDDTVVTVANVFWERIVDIPAENESTSVRIWVSDLSEPDWIELELRRDCDDVAPMTAFTT